VAIISNATTIADAGAFSAGQGAMVLIKTLTASSSSTLSFVDGASSVVLDDTYPIYKFQYINIHPATNNAEFTIGFRDGSTAYDAPKTTTVIDAYHSEDDSQAGIGYGSSDDLANATGFQTIAKNVGNDNDSSASGTLTLFNPSSTTFVKHFIARSNKMEVSVTADFLVSGFCNVTAAIDAVQFKFNSGNIDSGIIKLYGIKDS
jgi:hypothetical protein